MHNENNYTFLSKATADAIARATQLFAEDWLKAIAAGAAPRTVTSDAVQATSLDGKEVWGVEEAADFCGVKPRTIRSWVDDRERTGIPFFKPPNTRRLRFKVAALKAWFETSKPTVEK